MAQPQPRSKTGSQRDGLRARIVLRRSEGAGEAEVAKALGVSLTTVSMWSRRFELEGLNGLQDRPGWGRKAWLPADKVRQVVTQVVQPQRGRKKWSTRSMAAAAALSRQSVHRIWKANDLKPHLLRTFKISNDPQLAETTFAVPHEVRRRGTKQKSGTASGSRGAANRGEMLLPETQ